MTAEFFEWLKGRIDEFSNSLLEQKDGILFLPIDACERQLDFMRGAYKVVWNTANFKSHYYFNKDTLFVSGSIELYLLYIGGKEPIEFKRVVGCATIRIPENDVRNTHYDATVKSLAVVNAASDLGDRFGRYLSSQEKPIQVEREGKRKPDEISLQKWKNASLVGDKQEMERLESVFDFKTHENY